jgi:hypothetical protein
MTNNKPEIFLGFVLHMCIEIDLCDLLRILNKIKAGTGSAHPTGSIGLHTGTFNIYNLRMHRNGGKK